MAPSAHLLRTLAAVAPGARTVDAACGDGRHLDALARLGFDVWASTAGDPGPARQRLAAVVGDAEATRRVARSEPDALAEASGSADWVVLAGVAPRQLAGALAEAQRVLRPGGWVWVEVADGAEVVEAAHAAGLVTAEAPAEESGRIHAIFRRPGAVG